MRGWPGSSRPWPFERYADDAVVHCVSEAQAREVLAAIAERMEQVGLGCIPTRPGSCTARTATGGVARTSTPRSRSWGSRSGRAGAAARTGSSSPRSNPAISKEALKKISAEVRSWRLHSRTGTDRADLAREINPIVRGWMNYYGAFYRSALYPVS